MTQEVFEGRLSSIDEKSGTGARGPWTLYNLVLQTPQGEKRLGAGFNKPSVNANAAIRVSASQNAKGYWEADMKSLEVLPEEQAATSVPTVNQAMNQEQEKQRSIVTQTAYKIAAQSMDTLLSQGILTIKGGTTAATQNKALEAYTAMLDQIAESVFNRCTNPFEIQEQQEQGELEDDGDFDPLG